MTESERDALNYRLVTGFKFDDFSMLRDIYRNIVETYGFVRLADEMYAAARKQAACTKCHGYGRVSSNDPTGVGACDHA